MFCRYEEIDSMGILRDTLPDPDKQEGINQFIMKIMNHWFYQKYSLKTIANFMNHEETQSFSVLYIWIYMYVLDYGEPIYYLYFEESRRRI